MKNLQNILFIIGHEIEVEARLKENFLLSLLETHNLKITYLGDNDYENISTINEIASQQKKFAILIHANASNQKYRNALVNRIKFFKNEFKQFNIYIFSGEPSVKKDFRTEKCIDYTDLFDKINDESIWVKTTFTPLDSPPSALVNPLNLPIINESYDYLFITALYDAEFEYLELFCDFPEEQLVKEKENTHSVGTLKFDKSKKVVAIYQLNTGMIDAAILTAEMIARYKPKTVVMTGVCGGNPDKGNLNIGDIIIPNKIFTNEIGKKVIIDNKESFLKELNDVKISGGILTQIEKKKKTLLSTLKLYFHESNTPNWFNYDTLDIHINQPMVCSMSVVDGEGLFEKIIDSTERKTIGVEMESYAVARACELSDLKPKCLIIKSVMDKTKFKEDGGKRLAGQTSAKLLEEIIKAGII